MLLAFFGFLRVSKFTTGPSFDPTTHLALLDVSFDSPANPTRATISIKASKTDPFKEGCNISIGATGDSLCPTQALMV